MKIRDFKLENYIDDIRNKMEIILTEDIEKNRFGCEMEVRRVSIKEISEAGYKNRDEATMKVLNGFLKKDEVIESMKSLYKSKSENIIKAFKRQKEYADKILFDDKDYLELLDVLKDNYYCQALAMLEDMVWKKTKGASVKAMKYQARKMQADDISCD